PRKLTVTPVLARATARARRPSRLCREPHEPRPLLAADSEVRTRHVLGVPYAHGLFGDGDLDAVVARAAAVAGLEPDQFGRAHSSPRSRSSRPRESLGFRACERSVS